MNDVIINKAQIIDRCIIRINEEYDNNKENLKRVGHLSPGKSTGRTDE